MLHLPRLICCGQIIINVFCWSLFSLELSQILVSVGADSCSHGYYMPWVPAWYVCAVERLYIPCFIQTFWVGGCAYACGTMKTILPVSAILLFSLLLHLCHSLDLHGAVSCHGGVCTVLLLGLWLPPVYYVSPCSLPSFTDRFLYHYDLLPLLFFLRFVVALYAIFFLNRCLRYCAVGWAVRFLFCAVLP